MPLPAPSRLWPPFSRSSGMRLPTSSAPPPRLRSCVARRSVRRPVARSSLQLAIVREKLEYRYMVPSAWADGAGAHAARAARAGRRALAAARGVDRVRRRPPSRANPRASRAGSHLSRRRNSHERRAVHASERLSTGSAAFDRILGGGLPLRSVNVIAGEPGAGKTIFALQMLFHLARQGKKGLYFTTLSEPSLKLIRLHAAVLLLRRAPDR